jgi:hypothetical protein
MAIIGISGSYGGLNIGDEAILASIIASLRAARRGDELVVFSRNAAHTWQHQQADRVVDVRALSRCDILPEVGRLDLLLLGGGGILFDSEARIFLREVRLAQECGVPTFAWAVGAGPLDDPHEREAVRVALSCRWSGATSVTATASSRRWSPPTVLTCSKASTPPARSWAEIDRMWDERYRRSAQLRRRLPALKQRASASIDALLVLLRLGERSTS